jgi:hypothetical protein
MQSFTVQPLMMSQLHTAYPLIRAIIPTLELAAWSRYARRTANPRSSERRGIMVAVRAARPYPSGLFAYRKDLDPRHGTVLTADHFVALDLLDRQPVAAALITAMEAIGRRLGCDIVRAIVHHDAADVASSLLSAGHRLDGRVLHKAIGSAR